MGLKEHVSHIKIIKWQYKAVEARPWPSIAVDMGLVMMPYVAQSRLHGASLQPMGAEKVNTIPAAFSGPHACSAQCCTASRIDTNPRIQRHRHLQTLPIAPLLLLPTAWWPLPQPPHACPWQQGSRGTRDCPTCLQRNTNTSSGSSSGITSSYGWLHIHQLNDNNLYFLGHLIPDALPDCDDLCPLV